MSYSDQFKLEVLLSVNKIGVAKTSRLYKIGRFTIYRWQKLDISDKNKTEYKINSNSNSVSLVLRRVKIKNDKLQYYIYNIKDLYSKQEYNGISFESNYNTPVIFLKHILKYYNKSNSIDSYNILLKGFYTTNNLDKFVTLLKPYRIIIKRTNDKYDTSTYDKKEILKIKDKNNISSYLLESQLTYNLSLVENEMTDLSFLLPKNLDDIFSIDNEKTLFKILSAISYLLIR